MIENRNNLVNPTRGRGRPPKAEKSTTSVRRYQLVLPEVLFGSIQAIAEREQSTVLEVIRRLIRYGLVVFDIMKDNDSQLIIRKGEEERKIVLG